jgi:hypothetical protein
MNTMHTLTHPSRTTVAHPVVRERLSRSLPLRVAAWQLTQLIGHVHGAATGCDPAASAAALHRRYPALQALLAQGLATQPVATVHAVDRTLTDLVVEHEDGADGARLDAWASRLAGALVAA